MKGKRIISLVLVVAQILMLFSSVSTASAVSARSAKKVLKDIISVKEEWEDATTKRQKDMLHQEAEELREELLLTKEYKKDIRVSDRNFLVDEGEDPGFEKMVDVLCFPPYDTKENVEQVLNYLKAYDQSFWGTVCIAAGGIILTGTLIYGAVTYGSTIIAGAGMKVAEWKTAVSSAIKIAATDANKVNHIMQTKHAWEYVVSNAKWANVSKVVSDVMLYGNEIVLKNGYAAKELVVDGYTVQVQYNIINDVLTIVNAWVLTK